MFLVAHPLDPSLWPEYRPRQRASRLHDNCRAA
jgi:hypothetical protein